MAESVHAEVRVHLSALLVSLARAQMWDAIAALEEWADEWLDTDSDELEEFLDLEDPGA